MDSLQITFHELDHSDAVEAYVRQRAEKLSTTTPRLTACRVTLERPHRHAKHGAQYRVCVDVAVPGGEIVVSRSHEPSPVQSDLYAAIDAAFDAANRQLHDHARRQRGDVKSHAR